VLIQQNLHSCKILKFSAYLNAVRSACCSVPSKLMDRPSLLISHLMFCLFSMKQFSFLLHHCLHNILFIKPHQKTQRCKFFTSLIIISSAVLLVHGIRHTTELFISWWKGEQLTLRQCLIYVSFKTVL
jgi:hypothetical protein